MDRNVLHVSLAHATGVIVVTVRGEIDIVSVPRLAAALDCIDATYRVVVDMAGVTFMDSGGLTPLAIHTMRLRDRGGSLKIRNPSSAVRRVFESARMGDLLDFATPNILVVVPAETDRVQPVHDDLTHAAQEAHERQMHTMDLGLASRDIIGHAKGVIMVTKHCTAEEAFMLLAKQSQAENRKVVEIATQIASRA